MPGDARDTSFLANGHFTGPMHQTAAHKKSDFIMTFAVMPTNWLDIANILGGQEPSMGCAAAAKEGLGQTISLPMLVA